MTNERFGPRVIFDDDDGPPPRAVPSRQPAWPPPVVPPVPSSTTTTAPSQAPLPPPRGGPQVLESDSTERIIPVEPPRTELSKVRVSTTGGSRTALVVRPPPAPSRTVSLGLTGIGIAVAGWFVVDAYWWVAAAFERSLPLGVIAAAALIGGVAGAGVIIAREVRSLMALRSVEVVRERMSATVISPKDARQTITGILAVVPREPEVMVAIEAFQRQIQPHHNVAQQVEMLSRTVMKPLDQRAEAHVRTAVLRAFGITAISPTALSDALFFLACGVRMVRGIAASYGHRPTAATTVHLLRRLLLEAGKLGAVDIASTTLMQHLGGAVTERLATTAADSVYASYRMARLGIMVMDLCRPVPFRGDDVPSVSSLVSNAISHRSEAP
jgi:putative membrane protein